MHFMFQFFQQNMFFLDMLQKCFHEHAMFIFNKDS